MDFYMPRRNKSIAKPAVKARYSSASAELRFEIAYLHQLAHSLIAPLCLQFEFYSVQLLYCKPNLTLNELQ